jgi:hypothetical protein
MAVNDWFSGPWYVFTLDRAVKHDKNGDDLGYFYGGYRGRLAAVWRQQKLEYEKGHPCWVVRDGT